MRKPTFIEILLAINTFFIGCIAWSAHEIASYGVDISGWVDTDMASIGSALENLSEDMDRIRDELNDTHIALDDIKTAIDRK